MGVDATVIPSQGALSNTNPEDVGTTVGYGSASEGSRRDHVHELADDVVTLAKVDDTAISMWEPIADESVSGSAVASIDITGINPAYKWIKVWAMIETASAGNRSTIMQCNGDTTDANYFYRLLASSTGSTMAGEIANYPRISKEFSTETMGLFELTIVNDGVNQVQWRSFGTQGHDKEYVGFVWGVWESTADITQLTFSIDTGNIEVGSSVRIEGLR